MRASLPIVVLLIGLTECTGPADNGPKQTQTCSAAAPMPMSTREVFVGEGGATPFKPLAKGAVLTLDHGPQGGTHIYLDVMFRTPTAGRWVIKPRFKNAAGEMSEDQSVVDTCAGWNHIQHLRFVLSATGGGTLEIGVAPLESTTELTTESVDVTIR